MLLFCYIVGNWKINKPARTEASDSSSVSYSVKASLMAVAEFLFSSSVGSASQPSLNVEKFQRQHFDNPGRQRGARRGGLNA